MIGKFPVFVFGHVWTPPSLLSWLAAVFIDTDGGETTSSRTEADKEGMSLYAPFIITIKLNARGPYIHPLATQSSIPPLPGVPQFITPITQCSIEILILELPPTAILPFNPPNHQSVPRTGLHLISWPFYTPINFRNVTFQVFTLITTYQSYPTMS